MHSLWVKPHRKHLRNWVEDSSEPLVCTCQTLAVLFPHFGHSIRRVGIVWSSCTCLPMTATNCLGLCSMSLPLTLPSKSESCFLCPHLVHASMNIACFPEFTLIGFRIEPQSAQNSIDYFFVNFFLPNQPLTLLLALQLTVDSPDALGVYHSLPCYSQYWLGYKRQCNCSCATTVTPCFGLNSPLSRSYLYPIRILIGVLCRNYRGVGRIDALSLWSLTC